MKKWTPKEDRQILNFRLQCMRYEDIANIFNVSSDSVQRRLARIKKTPDQKKYLREIGKAERLNNLKEYGNELQQTKSELRAEQDRKAEAFQNKIIEAIKESMGKYFNTPKIIPQLKNKKGETETAILDCSDWHIGQGTNKAIERIKKMTEKTIHITRNLKNSKIKKLIIFLKGDMIEGEELFPTQPHEIDIKLLDQLAIGSRACADMVQELSKYYSIEIECVPGNHGRVGKRYAEETNWDCIFYIMLQSALKDNKRVKVNWTKKFDKIVDVEGFKFMLFHGDGIPMYNQTPVYGINNAVMSYISMLIEENHNLKYFTMGHFHTWLHEEINNREVIVTGCLPDMNSWTKKRIKKHPSISQALYFVHKDIGITDIYKLNLR